MLIGVFAALRGRPLLTRRMVQSFKKNALGEVFFVARLDDDDPAKDELSQEVDEALIGPRLSHGAAAPLNQVIMWGLSQKPFDLCVVAADDLECVTYGWDEILRAYRRIYPGGRVFAPDEGRKSGELLCHPVFTREWVSTLGYCVPTDTQHYYSDTWVERIAKLAGRYHYVPSLRFRHWVGASGDQEYINAKLSLMEGDRQAYLQGKAKQEHDAELLASS